MKALFKPQSSPRIADLNGHALRGCFLRNQGRAVFTPRSSFRSQLEKMDLQWFAAQDEGRTEEPTEHKLRKAREEGKVARSTELVSSVVLLFSVVSLGILSSFILHNLMDMITYFLGISSELDISKENRVVIAFLNYFLKIFLPIALVAFLAALIGNILQTGFIFTLKPLIPDFKRISPNLARFFRKAFMSPESGFNFAKSVIKILAIGSIAYININMEMVKIAYLIFTPFWVSLITIAQIAFRMLVEASIVLIVLSIPDYMFQRWQHKQSLMMSKQEIKEERKQYEGDPLVRSRLRERMRELLSRNMIQNVPRADVVVTNPTHFAVALEWDNVSMAAPMVIAKGQDNLAFKMREAAEENGVPIIENKPLARALYAEVEIGDIIPEKYWEVTAIILAQVYRMEGRSA